MRIIICETPDEAADFVTREILAALARKPDLVLGLATGSTPIPVYRRLIDAQRSGTADFARIRTFNLDEYVGLAEDDPRSYRTFMRAHLFEHLGVPLTHVHCPPVEGPDLEASCRAFEARIEQEGGIDIQLLGIGRNGHIGFNEPTSSLASRTRIVSLTDRTRADNARFFAPDETPPSLAVTMGIGTILAARSILLQAFGPAKADAIRRALEGPVSSYCPGSALQLHADVTVLADPPAAGRLTMRDYYRRAERERRQLEADGTF
jgi:glucosamine-6-phosphate deaminase